jgi:hypothetical protein
MGRKVAQMRQIARLAAESFLSQASGASTVNLRVTSDGSDGGLELLDCHPVSTFVKWSSMRRATNVARSAQPECAASQR